MSKALQEKAMLVNLSISSWTASKKDTSVTKAVKTQHGSAANAGWFNKRLIDPAALEPINKIEGRARDFHYKMTLPWGDNGDRVLSAMSYMDYVDAFRGFKTEYENAVNQFVKDYPLLVQGARTLLGTMYEPTDYPEVHRIKERFDIRVVYTPVPDADDFRVDVGESEVAEMRKALNASVEERLRLATRECWIRLDEVVGKMYTALSDPDRVFRDTLVENVRTVTALLPKMNLTNDFNLDVVIDTVRVDLVVNDIEALRKDKKYRLTIADKALKIQQEIAPWVKTEAFA